MSVLQLKPDLEPKVFGLARRWWNGLGFLACVACLGFAYFAQSYLGLEPCPLCIFQRLVFLALGAVFLAAALHNPVGVGGRLAYAILLGLTALVGAGIAGRQVWLQHLPPDQVPRCGPGLDYLLETLPLNEIVREVLTGSGECAKVDWTLLGLSMPAWCLLLFLGLGGLGAWLNGRRGARTAPAG